MKRFINQLTRPLGFEIERPSSGGRYNLWNPQYLATLYTPDIVIDIGVGNGTPSLYTAFPEAYLILFEPLSEFAPSINELLRARDGVLHQAAAGEKDGDVTINVDLLDLQRSSTLHRSGLTKGAARTEARPTTQLRIDSVVTPDVLAGKRVLMKIDAEGSELSVLKGSSRILSKIDFVIAEISIANRFDNAPGFSEIVSFMLSHRFKIHSFLSLEHIQGETQPRFCDVVFRNTI